MLHVCTCLPRAHFHPTTPATTAAAGRAAELKARNRKVAIYMASVVTAVLGVSYAAVPLYKVFCQVRKVGGLGGCGCLRA